MDEQTRLTRWEWVFLVALVLWALVVGLILPPEALLPTQALHIP
jgi:hypothetical protein